MLTNKSNALCVSISVLLVIFGIVFDNRIRIISILLGSRTEYHYMITITLMYISPLAFVFLVFLEHLITDFKKPNAPDVAADNRQQWMKPTRRWLYVFGISSWVAHGILTLEVNGRALPDDNLLLFSVGALMYLNLRYILFSFLMLTREYEGFTQYKKPQRERVHLNSVMFPMQYALLGRILFVKSRQQNTESVTDSWKIWLCRAIFFFSTIAFLFNLLRAADANERSKQIFSQRAGAKACTKNWILYIFPCP